MDPVELSPLAKRIATLLCERSEHGLEHMDPSMEPKELAGALTDTTEADLELAVDELVEADFVSRSTEFADPFPDIWPTPFLFFAFDPVVKGWEAAGDAHALANAMVNAGKEYVSAEELRASLNWSPRRFNPAAYMLVLEDRVAPSDELDHHPFSHAGFVVTPRTKRFAMALPPSAAQPTTDVATMADGFRYEVALSFAGEDRVHADTLASRLHEHSVKVFYDQNERAELWGKDLTEHLYQIYSKSSRYCVIFSSRHYKEKEWTRLELRSALERALKEKGSEYILPIRIDNTELPGLPSSIAHVDISIGIDSIANDLLHKLGRGNSSPPSRGVRDAEPAAVSLPAIDDSQRLRKALELEGQRFLEQQNEIRAAATARAIELQRHVATTAIDPRSGVYLTPIINTFMDMVRRMGLTAVELRRDLASRIPELGQPACLEELKVQTLQMLAAQWQRLDHYIEPYCPGHRDEVAKLLALGHFQHGLPDIQAEVARSIDVFGKEVELGIAEGRRDLTQRQADKMALFAELQKQRPNIALVLEPGTYRWELAEELVAEGCFARHFGSRYMIKTEPF